MPLRPSVQPLSLRLIHAYDNLPSCQCVLTGEYISFLQAQASMHDLACQHVNHVVLHTVSSTWHNRHTHSIAHAHTRCKRNLCNIPHEDKADPRRWYPPVAVRGGPGPPS